MRSEPSDIVFTERVTAWKHVTVYHLGVQLASETPDKLAGILLAFANDIPGWGSEIAGWGVHCTRVAGELSPDECSTIAGVLEPLVAALRSRPEPQLTVGSSPD